MSTGDIFLFTMFGLVYLAVVLTIGIATFKKGRKVLFYVGFIMPLLWLLGAILPAKSGSKQDRDDDAYWDQQSSPAHRPNH